MTTPFVLPRPPQALPRRRFPREPRDPTPPLTARRRRQGHPEPRILATSTTEPGTRNHRDKSAATRTRGGSGPRNRPSAALRLRGPTATDTPTASGNNSSSSLGIPGGARRLSSRAGPSGAPPLRGLPGSEARATSPTTRRASGRTRGTTRKTSLVLGSTPRGTTTRRSRTERRRCAGSTPGPGRTIEAPQALLTRRQGGTKRLTPAAFLPTTRTVTVAGAAGAVSSGAHRVVA